MEKTPQQRGALSQLLPALTSLYGLLQILVPSAHLGERSHPFSLSSLVFHALRCPDLYVMLSMHQRTLNPGVQVLSYCVTVGSIGPALVQL